MLAQFSFGGSRLAGASTHALDTHAAHHLPVATSHHVRLNPLFVILSRARDPRLRKRHDSRDHQSPIRPATHDLKPIASVMRIAFRSYLAAPRSRVAPSNASLHRVPRAFTLIELLLVLGLVAVLSVVLSTGFSGHGKSAALQSGQAAVASLLAAARARAVASGHQVRVLIQHDPRSPHADRRYLRFLALEESHDGIWETLLTSALPEGIYILPHQNRTPPGLWGAGSAWTKLDGSRLHSSCLSRPPVSRAVDALETETWAEILFAAPGTTSTSGFLVIAAGRVQPAAARTDDNPPVVLENREAVRGLLLSSYGLATAIDGRSGF